ncbi:hypothetical protein [Novosphingobium sp.]|uniref:hypothetical protein n=1 Tax=Novosphingobium sp. TaxID=1874826 RepID=UPI00286B44E9|nr:hypothetical protein [Novosphingobium sp.]
MSIWKSANPTGAIADFIEVYRQAGANRFRIGLVAALCTFGVFSIMMTQSWKKQRKLPEVTYINSWPLDRTAEETRAFIEANQRLKDAQEEIQAANAAEEQKLWMALGKVSGMNVDAIKAKAEADKAAEQARAAAKAKAQLDR